VLGRQGAGASGLLGRLAGAFGRLLGRLTRLPTLPKVRRPRKVSRDIALSTHYANPMQDASLKARMNPKELVEYSYAALCALAYDMAVPRSTDQTPFEFIRSFPKPMDTLRDVARDLTNLYVLAAYSEEDIEEVVERDLRNFWYAFERVRAKAIR